MRLLQRTRTVSCCVAGLCLLGLAVSIRAQSKSHNRTDTASCPDEDTGLKLPRGFCAAVFADGIGHARHIAVSRSGVVYVNTWLGRYYGNEIPRAGGFLVALQDKTGAGKTDIIERFGETAQTGGRGGTGIGLYEDGIYAEINHRIVRYTFRRAQLCREAERKR